MSDFLVNSYPLNNPQVKERFPLLFSDVHVFGPV